MHVQPSLFPDLDKEQEWDSSSWETPDDIARKMAALILPSDQRILEPAAGAGQIAKYFPRDRHVVCVEIKRDRYRKGLRFSHQQWMNKDFLRDDVPSPFDLVITNPPFNLSMEFLERSLSLLDRSNPDTRVLFLMPGDTFAACDRNARFQAMDAHIHHRYDIVNRVAYLKNGQRVKGRQIFDTVFEIRPGKAGACVTFI